MAWKRLGAIFPDPQEMTLIYVCPPDRQATLSTLYVCNQGLDTTFRVAVFDPEDPFDGVSGGGFLYWDEEIRENESFPITTGITLQESFELWGWSGNGAVSFSAFGVEIDEDPA